MTHTEDKILSEHEFIVRAIKKLRKPPYKGIHSVYSGFNQAFREYFGRDPVEATQRFSGEGKIVTRPVKGGVLIMLPEDAPVQSQKSALNKILEDDEPEKDLEILGPADHE